MRRVASARRSGDDGGTPMANDGVKRRDLLVGGVLASAASVPARVVEAAPQPAPAAAPAPPGYLFLKPAEAAFVEALVDHMIPADALSPSGTDLGVAVFIDRALGGSWGKGDRLYMQGPWRTGSPSQGYQLPLTPAELYRAGMAESDAWCRKAYGRVFSALPAEQKEAFLKALAAGEVKFASRLPSRTFFDLVYQTVMEGMFADPIYGGNRDKAGWTMLGFPGVLANNAENIKRYSDGQRFPARPVSISDMS